MLINLHSHLEGRVRPSTAAELAGQAGVVDPPEGWASHLQLTGPDTLTVYLAKVAATYPFFRWYEGLRRIAFEAVEDAAADGGDYLELRFGPATHVSPGLDIDAVVAAVCEGVVEGTRVSGMPAGVVVAALRHHDEDVNVGVAEVAARFAGRGVVGFDLAGDEILFPDCARFAAAYQIAGAAGLGLTCHAAEAGPAAGAREAVEVLGVSRIGHGVHIPEDPDVLAWIADSGVTVEACPTSNWYTGGIPSPAAHPARTFVDAGIPIVLGDDNPRQTLSLLSQERDVLRDALGFDAADLARVDRASVTALFAEPSVRASLTARL